jgi:colanic acid/amylovoran biosynthesis glycosyltransferase
VLVLATTFPATPGDGTPEFVLTLASRLARSGCAITVLAPRTPGAVRTEVIDGVRVRRFRYFPRRWERLADGAIMANLRAHPLQALQVLPLVVTFLFSALITVRRQRPQVMHAHWIVPAGVVARIVHLFTRLPYIVTVHGADAYTLRGRGARAIKRSVMKHAHATIPVSGDIGTVLSDLGSIKPAVPMGVDADRIRAEVGHRRPEPGRVLFVGRLVEKKGVDVLLHAMAAVPQASVVIAGGGPLEASLKDLAQQLGIAERVEFLGAVSRNEVMHQMGRASVVTLPSRVGAGGDQDGVPVVLGEAIAAGVPVIVSGLGGLGEYLTDGKTGGVVSPGSGPDLATALVAVLGDPDAAARFAEAAAAEVLPTLTIEHTSAAYLAVLKSASVR